MQLVTDRKVLKSGEKPTNQIIRFKAIISATKKSAKNLENGQMLLFPNPVPSHTPRVSNRPIYRHPGVSQNPSFPQRSPGFTPRNLQSGLSGSSSTFSSRNSMSGFSSEPPKVHLKSSIPVSDNSYELESIPNDVKPDKENKKGGKFTVVGMRLSFSHSCYLQNSVVEL